MTKYAYFDSSAPAPSAVLGWYDTAEFAYPQMPNASDLLEVTPAEWGARLSNPSGWAVNSGALVAYVRPAPALSLSQQASAALAAGLTITSTSTPALDGTYPVDSATQSQIQAEMIAILANGAFASGGATLDWLDTSGAGHTFTVAQFKALATAVAAYVSALLSIAKTNVGTLPTATATIA